MRTSKKGIDLITYFEGDKLKAYVCPAGKITISRGLTYYPNGNSIKIGDTITQKQSDEYFKQVLVKFEDSVNRLVRLKIHQYMFDSLVSFCFNCGIGNFQSSTLLKKINLGDFIGASNEFLKWNKAQGKELPGLTKRRQAEKELFLQGLKELEINDIIGG